VRAEGASRAGILALRRALVISKREIDERLDVSVDVSVDTSRERGPVYVLNAQIIRGPISIYPKPMNALFRIRDQLINVLSMQRLCGT